MRLIGPSWAKSGAALALVLAIAGSIGAHFEGQRLTAYADLGGVWTLCDGHTTGVKPGDTATPEQCRAYLEQDMGHAYAAVNRCITADLTIAQAAAFTDAAFNLGPQVVCGSTLQRMANAGDIRGACEQLTRWTYAAGQELPGLVRRRQAERDLCVEGLR